MTKGVFGSKNQAAWVWTAGDTDSDLLTDDDQLGRKCSEPVTICRRELRGRIFGVQDCSYLTLMIWKGGGSVRSIVGQWRRGLGKVSWLSERIIFMVICKWDTSGFKSQR